MTQYFCFLSFFFFQLLTFSTAIDFDRIYFLSASVDMCVVCERVSFGSVEDKLHTQYTTCSDRPKTAA